MGVGGLEQVLGGNMWFGAGLGCCTQAGLPQDRLSKDGGWVGVEAATGHTWNG